MRVNQAQEVSKVNESGDQAEDGVRERVTAAEGRVRRPEARES